MSNHQLVHHQSNFTTWSMLLSWHCQEIWSSTVTMLIILLKSLTRISQFMTLCWWFYFQIGLSICDLILQFMLMILLGSSVWGFYDLVAHFGWWFCLSHVWGFFMILLRNLCWWFHLSWVQGFYDLFTQFMLMKFLELDLFQDFMILFYVHLCWWFFLNLARISWSCCIIYVDDFAWDECEDFMILMHNLCWWFCLSQVQGFYDLDAQFMFMTLPQSYEDFIILLYSLCWWSFAWVSWGYYDLVGYNWCWWFVWILHLKLMSLLYVNLCWWCLLLRDHSKVSCRNFWEGRCW